jgi:hypothetical protein
MHKALAQLLSTYGLPAKYHDPTSDDDPDYSAWVVTNDGSISMAHQVDGYCELLFRACVSCNLFHSAKAAKQAAPRLSSVSAYVNSSNKDVCRCQSHALCS